MALYKYFVFQRRFALVHPVYDAYFSAMQRTRQRETLHLLFHPVQSFDSRWMYGPLYRHAAITPSQQLSMTDITAGLKNSYAYSCTLAKDYRHGENCFIVFEFLFHDISCNITQQIIKQSEVTHYSIPMHFTNFFYFFLFIVFH